MKNLDFSGVNLDYNAADFWCSLKGWFEVIIFVVNCFGVKIKNRSRGGMVLIMCCCEKYTSLI